MPPVLGLARIAKYFNLAGLEGLFLLNCKIPSIEERLEEGKDGYCEKGTNLKRGRLHSPPPTRDPSSLARSPLRILGAHDHPDHIPGPVCHARDLLREVEKGGPIREGEQEEDGVRFLSAGLQGREEKWRAANSERQRVSPCGLVCHHPPPILPRMLPGPGAPLPPLRGPTHG